MTKWKEELDKIIKLDEEGNTVFSLLDVQDFIEENKGDGFSTK